MTTQLDRPALEAMLRAKLVELIELSMEHHIDIMTLIDDALHIADYESIARRNTRHVRLPPRGRGRAKRKLPSLRRSGAA